MMRLHIALAAAAAALMTNGAMAVTPTGDEMAAARRWADSNMHSALRAPFSFQYGGRPSGELLSTWEFATTSRNLDQFRTQRTDSWRDPESGLQVRCISVSYADFPVIEWTVYLKNTGTADTPIVEHLQGLDAALLPAGTKDCVLHHNVGSPCQPNDYQPLLTPLPPGAEKRIGAAGGRPTNSDLAYFNAEGDSRGVILAVGWPGQWSALFDRQTDGSLKVTAGQERTRFVLHPGEEVRTPLIALLFWQGDYPRSQNLWRRWMVAHNLPRPGGKLPPLTQTAACSSHQFGEMIHANEANQMMFVDRYAEEKLGLDYWWMDAGWYVNDGSWPNTGTWEVDTKRFPNGLRSISDHARKGGVRTIVWFEPERVTPHTWLYDERPQWLLKGATQGSLEGLAVRRSAEGPDPCATFNGTGRTLAGMGITWRPGQFALHPGPAGQFSVLRWTAAEAGEHIVSAEFTGIAELATTDVHVLLNGREAFGGWIDAAGGRKSAATRQTLSLSVGDTLDFAVGWGNGQHVNDTTGLDLSVTPPAGAAMAPSEPAVLEENPHGPWACGWLAPGDSPDSSTFRPYDRYEVKEEGGQRLLDMGNPEARAWLTGHVDRTLKEQGIDLYRQDFNIDPLTYWRANDAPDREGITENRYVTGYLAYWDELRRRHPDMLIDSCASGGRRNDLETLRRAVPLLRSDYLLEPVSQQCHTYGIAAWYPFYGTAAPHEIDRYRFRSVLSPHLTLCYDMRETGVDFAPLRQWLREWRTVVAPHYFSDFYTLTDYSLEPGTWMAWQFDSPETGKGVVQAFRRDQAEQAALRVKLHGLDSGAEYTVTDIDTGQSRRLRGSDLMGEGLDMSIPDRPGAAILRYERER